MIKKLLFLLSLLGVSVGNNAKSVYDDAYCNVQRLFLMEKTKYIIQYAHQFSDTLIVPKNCEICFSGGSLSGPIKFNDTKLTGKVNLKGSSIGGQIKNKIFDASWLCAMNGETDDAPKINEIIEVCDNIFFPKGTYRLISAYDASKKVGEECLAGIKAHIGINRNNVSLKGEYGTVFITSKPLCSICVFSQPKQIDKNISNINIKGITFEVQNDGKNFYEFMHTIKLIGINGITIEDCEFNDFWGDAICLSHYGDNLQTGERTRNQNVKILNNTIIGGDHHNNRNGISVINGKDVLIKGNTIKNTSRKDMPGGIDVEPNNSAYTIENIRIENNVLEGIKGSGGAICVVVMNGGPAHRISIIGNKISKSSNGLFVYVKTEGTSDNFVIKNNVIASDTRPYYFKGSGKSRGWTISGNTFNRPCTQVMSGDIKVENLVVKNNKKKDK